jgi:hypothetical protein
MGDQAAAAHTWKLLKTNDFLALELAVPRLLDWSA